MAPFAEIVRAIEEAESAALPALVAAFAEAHALALRRLVEEAARPPVVRLLTVDEAAELAHLPRRRVFSLSRGKRWAVRVGRTLLVEATAFQKWLVDSDRECSESARTDTKPAPRPRAVDAGARSCAPVTRRAG